MSKTPENPPELILASTSATRRAILNNLKLPFSAIEPQFIELHEALSQPRRRALENGRGKALSIPVPITQLGSLHRLVIGSDQVCISATGQTLHKPGTKDRAKDQLRQVSGQWVTFYTSIVVAQCGKVLKQAVIPSQIKFRSINDIQIERYINADQPFHSAGSILIEGAGLRLIEQIKTADVNALYGLPALKLMDFLQELNVELSYQS